MKKALISALVADAATVPLHWHYDTGKLRSLLKDAGRINCPEFLLPMQTQFYNAKEFPGHYDIGQMSVYGEQAIMMMEYLSQYKKHKIVGEDFTRFMYTWFKKYTGRYDHPTKEFIQKYEEIIAANPKALVFPFAGAHDSQTMFAFKVVPLVLFHNSLSETDLLEEVEIVTRAHQNHDVAAKFARIFALMLKMSLEGLKFGDIVVEILKHADEDVKECIEFAWSRKSRAILCEDGWDESLDSFSKELSNWLFGRYGGNEGFRDLVGKSCNLPGSFMVAIKIIGDTLETIETESFKENAWLFAIRRNINFGGDNCGRTMVLTSLLSLQGAEVPKSCLQQFKELLLVEGFVKEL